MATMNVSLPAPMKDWVEAQARTGHYSNASDYVRDLIRKDQERTAKIAHMQRVVTDALESGISDQSMHDIEQTARRETGADPGGHGLQARQNSGEEPASDLR